MNAIRRTWRAWPVLLLLAAGTATAAEDDIMPAVDTSAVSGVTAPGPRDSAGEGQPDRRSSPADAAAGDATPGAGSAAPAKQASGGDAEGQSPGDAGPADATSRAAPSPQPRNYADRMQLDSTAIRGNRELPRVMYIVPWKDPALGDIGGKPVNSLVDEVLAPLDRDVFQRQTSYFDQLYGSPGTGGPE